MPSDFGLKIGIEGEKEFKKALSDEPADAKAEQKDAEFPPKQLNEAAAQSSESAKQKDKDQA